MIIYTIIAINDKKLLSDILYIYWSIENKTWIFSLRNKIILKILRKEWKNENINFFTTYNRLNRFSIWLFFKEGKEVMQFEWNE